MNFDSHLPRLLELLHDLTSARALPFHKLVPGALPPRPGVYRIFETSLPSGTVYVGRTVNLRGRIYRSHLMGNQGVSTLKRKLLKQGRYPAASDVKAYLRQDCSVQLLVLESDVERLRLEHFAIALLRPWYNS